MSTATLSAAKEVAARVAAKLSGRIAKPTVDPADRDGDYVIRRGKIFEFGSYPDKDFSITPAEFEAANRGHGPIPIDLSHTPTVLDGKLGSLVSAKVVGNELHGEVRLPRWLDEQLEDGKRRVSVDFDRKTKRLRKLSIVPKPHIKDAAIFSGKRPSPLAPEQLKFAGRWAAETIAAPGFENESPEYQRAVFAIAKKVHELQKGLTKPATKPENESKLEMWTEAEFAAFMEAGVTKDIEDWRRRNGLSMTDERRRELLSHTPAGRAALERRTVASKRDGSCAAKFTVLADDAQEKRRRELLSHTDAGRRALRMEDERRRQSK